MRRKSGILLIVIILSFGFGAYGDDCSQWFKDSGISPTDKSCVTKCSSLITDMGTIGCTDRCEDFCESKKKPKCEPNKPWDKLLRDGKPSNWPHKREISSQWTKKDRELLSRIFSRLPQSFKADGIKGIYKLEKPSSFYTFGTDSVYYESQIIFYKRAFNGTKNVEDLIVHEFAHHLHETELKKPFEDYKKQMGWKASGDPRPGDFIDADSKSSPEEDFATNFHTYILEQKKLVRLVPNAHRWMKKILKDTFKLKECDK
jgi:hypothetical protein